MAREAFGGSGPRRPLSYRAARPVVNFLEWARWLGFNITTATANPQASSSIGFVLLPSPEGNVSLMSVSESTVAAVVPTNPRLRTAALVGTGLALLLALIRSASVTENDLGFAIWIVLTWCAVMGLLLRKGRRLLWARPEILVPAGLLLPLDVAIHWMSAADALKPLMKPLATISIWGGGVTLSVPFVLLCALWSAFAAWQTDLLARGVTDPGPLDLFPVAIRRDFWRAFGVLAVGNVGLVLLTMPVLRIFGSDEFAGFAFFLGFVTFLWNVATFALVPWVLLSPEPFTVAVASGFRQARSNKLLFSRLVVLQLALLGFWTYFSTWGNWSYHVHSFWIGGYECDNHWYTDHQAWQTRPPSPFVMVILEGLFLILAVAVKTTVVERLLAKPTAVAGMDHDPETG